MMLRIQIRNGKEHLQQCLATLGKQKFWEDVPVVFESEDKAEEIMNDKDTESFKNWLKDNFSELIKMGNKGGLAKMTDDLEKCWLAACEYKQKEIDELNQKLSNIWKDAEEFYLDD